jgi:hypothetical protein
MGSEMNHCRRNDRERIAERRISGLNRHVAQQVWMR